MPRPSPLMPAVAAVALVALAAGCSGDGDAGADGPGTTGPSTTTTAGAPAFTPVTGGLDDDGDPLPPPVHAVVSVVVRGDSSWFPYAGRELGGLDPEAAATMADRLRQIDGVLREAGIAASVELAYGPAAALCAEEPEVLDLLESHGHVIGIHARTFGESFRAVSALEECGRTAATASGVAAMADPVGPDPTTTESLADAFALLRLQEIRHVTGAISPLCEELGLAGHTNEYGTDAFTAPWRSAWSDGNPCADATTGEVVVVDQVRLAPGSGDERIDADAIDALRTPFAQTLGWATDQRYKEPSELPPPGMLTWGITMRLDDLVAPAETSDDTADETADDAEATTTTAAAPVDPRTAPLSEETLAALATLLADWQPAVDDGRLVWVTPEDVAAVLRPT